MEGRIKLRTERNNNFVMITDESNNKCQASVCHLYILYDVKCLYLKLCSTMVNKTCFSDGCYTGSDKHNSPPPKAHYEKWQNQIPKMGSPRTSFVLDIVKRKIIGEILIHQEKGRLKDGTMPKYLLGN